MADKDQTLKDLALRLGASVRLSNGEVFNSDGERAKVRPGAVKMQKETPDTADMLRMIAEMLAKQQPTHVVVPESPPPTVVVEAPQVTVQPAPVPTVRPVSYKFTFERSESGLIRSITATPLP